MKLFQCHNVKPYTKAEGLKVLLNDTGTISFLTIPIRQKIVPVYNPVLYKTNKYPSLILPYSVSDNELSACHAAVLYKYSIFMPSAVKPTIYWSLQSTSRTFSHVASSSLISSSFRCSSTIPFSFVSVAEFT